MLTHEWFIQALSIIGAIIVLSAYIGHQLHVKIFNPEHYFYNICNLVAGVLLTYVACSEFQLGFIFMEGAWALISGYTVMRIYWLKRKKISPQNS